MKNKDISNIFEVFMCYTGAVIGAGFASGQEIMSFFAPYGKNGILGIFACGVIFFIYGYIVLKKIFLCNINSFNQYFEDIAGRKIATIIQGVSYGFMFASFCVMVSGSGAVSEELFGTEKFGIFFMAVLCFFVFAVGLDGMVAVNAFMAPLIIIGIIAIGIYAVVFESRGAFASHSFLAVTDNFVASSLVYVSYNTVTLIGVLLPLKEKITSLRTALISSLLSGGALALMGALLWIALKVFESDIYAAPVPMLRIAENAGNIMKYVYGAVLYMAMITTAVSSGFALLSFCTKHLPLSRTSIAGIICGVSVPLAYIGFSDLVNKLYRFFGFLGLFVLFAVIFDGLRFKKQKNT